MDQEAHHHHHCHCHHGQLCPNKRLFVTAFQIDYHEAGDDLRSHFTANTTPLFSWALQTTGTAQRQTACQITVSQEDELLWDSGMVETSRQELTYAGTPLPCGPQLTLTLTVKDDCGNTSEPFASFFYVATREWQAPWIASATPDTVPTVFRKLFSITKTVDSARLYVSAQGLQRILLNGAPLDEGPVDEAPLDPPATPDGQPPQFVFYPEIQDQLEEENCLAITVAQAAHKKQLPMLTATLVIDFADGSTEQINTDDSWTCAPSPVLRNDLHGGILFDERLRNPNHDLHPDTLMAEDEDDLKDKQLDAPGATVMPELQAPAKPLFPMILPPVAGNDDQLPTAQWPMDNTSILDFGKLISGVVRLRIPEHLPHDTQITIRYASELEDDGTLATNGTLPQDTYIASGHEDDERFFHPLFTCHTFRYAQITGLGAYIPPMDVAAVSLRMNLDKDSTFTCANPLLNDLSKRCLNKQHATYQGYQASQIPWHSSALKLLPFPSTMDTTQLVAEALQQAPGSPETISPAQANAVLIAVCHAYLASGNHDLLKQALPLCQAWLNTLDAAEHFSPTELCHACHACKLATDIAQEAKETQCERDFYNRFQQLRQNFRQRCLKPQQSKLDDISTKDLALALCLSIAPEANRDIAQKLCQRPDLHLTSNDACFILDALTANGYVDLAYQLLNSEWIQNTETLASPGLSHWLYARLAGITLTAPAAEAIRICPVFPIGLASVNATMQTAKGPVTVHWFRRNQALHLHVTVPFGAVATVCFNNQEQSCTTGFHTFAMNC